MPGCDFRTLIFENKDPFRLVGLANNECKPPEVRGSHPPELDTRRADICRFDSLMSMLAGHGRCYFLITWGHAASILLIASLPYREMYKLPPLEVSLIDKSVFSCEAPRALQAQAVLLSLNDFLFLFLQLRFAACFVAALSSVQGVAQGGRTPA